MPRFTVELSSEIDSRLTAIARKQGISKSEAMKRAFALLSIADQETAKGNTLGIVREDTNNHELMALGRVVGLQ